MLSDYIYIYYQKTTLWGDCLDEGWLIIERGDCKNRKREKFSEHCPTETC